MPNTKLPITLDQLEVFLAVADAGGFSAAARAVGRSQSTVSKAIANLERLLGLSLFERSHRHTTLTAAGQSLLARARAVQTHADALRAQAHAMAEGKEAHVRLGVDVFFPNALLIELLKAFRLAHPLVPLILHTEALGTLPELVLNTTCDLAIAGGPLGLDDPRLERRFLLRTPMLPVVSPHHPLAQQACRATLQELRSFTQLIVTDRSGRTGGQTVAVAGGERWCLTDLSTKHAFLREGLGWGLMPQHRVQEDLDQRRLLPLLIDAWPETLDHNHVAIFRTDRPPGPATRWLLDALSRRCDAHEP